MRDRIPVYSTNLQKRLGCSRIIIRRLLPTTTIDERRSRLERALYPNSSTHLTIGTPNGDTTTMLTIAEDNDTDSVTDRTQPLLPMIADDNDRRTSEDPDWSTHYIPTLALISRSEHLMATRQRCQRSLKTTIDERRSRLEHAIYPNSGTHLTIGTPNGDPTTMPNWKYALFGHLIYHGCSRNCLAQ